MELAKALDLYGITKVELAEYTTYVSFQKKIRKALEELPDYRAFVSVVRGKQFGSIECSLPILPKRRKAKMALLNSVRDQINKICQDFIDEMPKSFSCEIRTFASPGRMESFIRNGFGPKESKLSRTYCRVNNVQPWDMFRAPV